MDGCLGYISRVHGCLVYISHVDGCIDINFIIMIIIININITSSTGQSKKHKIIYKLLTQPHKHLRHLKLKNKLREATND